MKKIRCVLGGMNLRTKLIISYVLLLLLPMTLLGGYASSGIERLLVEQSRNAYQETLRQTALSMQSVMDNCFSAAASVRSNERLVSALRILRIRPLSLGEEYDTYKQIRAIMDSLLQQPGIRHVRLAVNGSATFVSDGFDIFSLLTLYDDLAWQQLSGQYALWLPSRAFTAVKIEEMNTFQLCMRISDTTHHTSVLGYLLAEVEADMLLRPMEGLTLPDGGFLTLYDAQGIMIHRSGKTGAKVDGNGAEAYLTMEARLLDGQWMLRMDLPRGSVLRTRDGLPRTILFMAAVLSVAGILFAVAVTRSIDKRLQTTLRGIRRVEAGELGATIVVEGEDEYSRMQEAFNRMSLRIEALVDDLIRTQAQQKQAEMRILYEQINPHFVYNTLDVIRWEALRNKAEPLAELADMLVAYLRLSLNHGQEMIEVSREMDMIGRYMHIMNYRYQDAIAYAVEMDPDILNIYMPKMVLQPLVENAVLHGIMGTRERRGRIEVRGWQEGDTLFFTVTDDGAGMEKERMDSLLGDMKEMHYGLYNVSERLRACYGEGSGLRFESAPRFGTTVTVVMHGVAGAGGKLEDKG